MIICIIIFYLNSFLALAVYSFLLLIALVFSHYSVKGRVNGLEVEPISRKPEERGSIPHLGRSSLITIEHAELLRSTPLLVLCCA